MGSRQGTELLGRASGEQSLEGASVLLLESVSNLVGNLPCGFPTNARVKAKVLNSRRALAFIQVFKHYSFTRGPPDRCASQP